MASQPASSLECSAGFVCVLNQQRYCSEASSPGKLAIRLGLRNLQAATKFHVQSGVHRCIFHIYWSRSKNARDGLSLPRPYQVPFECCSTCCVARATTGSRASAVLETFAVQLGRAKPSVDANYGARHRMRSRAGRKIRNSLDPCCSCFKYLRQVHDLPAPSAPTRSLGAAAASSQQPLMMKEHRVASEECFPGLADKLEAFENFKPVSVTVYPRCFDRINRSSAKYQTREQSLGRLSASAIANIAEGTHPVFKLCFRL